MVKLTMIVEDNRADIIAKSLKDDLNVKDIEVEKIFPDDSRRGPLDTYTRIKEILDEVKGRDLFKGIEDPSEWQRQIRGEWDRDF